MRSEVLTDSRIEQFLRDFPERTLSPGTVMASLKDKKSKAVAQDDQNRAKYIWCLAQTLRIQETYRGAFDKLKNELFYPAWCSLEDAENGLSLLERHFDLKLSDFWLRFIREHVAKWQSLFPYSLFSSPEMIIQESVCSICSRPISIREPCGHKVGEIYNGESCYRIVKKADIVSISVVTNPVQKYSVLFLKSEDGSKDKDHYDYSLPGYAIKHLASPVQGWRVEWTERRHPHSRYSHVGPGEKCPCGSELEYGKCCLLTEGVLRPHVQFTAEVPISEKNASGEPANAPDDPEGAGLMTDKPKRIFISYSQNSTSYKKRVVELAQQLRDDGFNCMVDSFVNGTPSEGWPLWMEKQVEQSNYVLVLCSETYLRRFMADEQKGVGLGATWESVLVRQDMYEMQAENVKYIPVLFDKRAKEYIPKPLRPYTYYFLPDDYEKLYRYLTKQPETVPAPIGNLRNLSSPQQVKMIGVENSRPQEPSTPQLKELEQYRAVSADPKDIYYEIFLQNMFAREKYSLALSSGARVVGIPTVGSIFNPEDPNASFSLDTEDRPFRIPFSELASARLVSAKEGVRKRSVEPDKKKALMSVLQEVADESGAVSVTENEIAQKLDVSSYDMDIHGLMIRLKEEGAFVGSPYFESGGAGGSYFSVTLRQVGRTSMNPYRYADEKFSDAIRSLTGAGALRTRLLHAWVDSLIFLRSEQLPPSIKDDFARVRAAVTRIESEGDEGSLEATISRLSDEELSEIVDELQAMYEIVVAEWSK